MGCHGMNKGRLRAALVDFGALCAACLTLRVHSGLRVAVFATCFIQ